MRLRPRRCNRYSAVMRACGGDLPVINKTILCSRRAAAAQRQTHRRQTAIAYSLLRRLRTHI
jgi:hypothetical protein